MPLPVRHLVIAGGGIAALELVLALRSCSADHPAITMVAPDTELLYRPEAVLEPFSGAARRYPLPDLAGALDVHLVNGRVSSVEATTRRVHLDAGGSLSFDELVIAAGAHAEPAVPHATTLRAHDAEILHWIAAELEDGSAQDVALVAGPTSGWALPAYELALLLADRARAMDVGDRSRVTLVTHEHRPLQVFGGRGSDAVARALADAGVRVLGGHARTTRTPEGLRLDGNGDLLSAQRVIALQALSGPRIRGLPLGPGGFVRVDGSFAVVGRPGVHAIGDAAESPVKQGGLAAQQADLVAARIAARAGIPTPEVPAHLTLRATLITGERRSDRLYLSGPLIGGEVVDTTVTDTPPAWADQKIAATRLTPFLEDVAAHGIADAGLRRLARGRRHEPVAITG